MDKSFKECFAELCADRASDAIVSARQKDAEIVEAQRNLVSVLEQVSQLLDSVSDGLLKQSTLTKLSDAYSRRQICETRLAYEQGMRDGLRLNKIVGGVA